VQEAKVREDKLEKWLACVPGYESFWAFSQNKKGYSGEC
jgi:exonuclease III